MDNQPSTATESTPSTDTATPSTDTATPSTDTATPSTDTATPSTESAPSEPPAQESVPQEPLVDRMHTAASTQILTLSHRIDSFFYDPAIEPEVSNQTLMRIRLGCEFGESGEIDLLQRIYLRLSLPEAERRLHLLFFQRDEDANTTEQPNTVFSEQSDQIKFSLNSGLRYVISDSRKQRLQFLIGSRIYPGIDPFAEIRGRLALPLGAWAFYPAQHLFWRDEIGFGETTLFDIDYPLARSVRLRLHADGTFSESSSGFEYNLSTSYAQEIRMQRGFRIDLSLAGHTRPENDVVHYLATFTWRQRIFRDWLYIEPAIKLLFPQDEGYDVVPSVIVMFEAVFGEAAKKTW